MLQINIKKNHKLRIFMHPHSQDIQVDAAEVPMRMWPKRPQALTNKELLQLSRQHQFPADGFSPPV